MRYNNRIFYPDLDDDETLKKKRKLLNIFLNPKKIEDEHLRACMVVKPLLQHTLHQHLGAGN